MYSIKKILLISDGLAILSGGLIGPIYALLVQRYGGDLLDASATFAIFMITAGVVIYFMAFWEDRFKHQRKFIIIGYGLSMVGTGGYLLAQNATHLFFVQAVLGLAVAIKDPAYDAIFSRSDQKHLTLAWREWEAMDYVILGLSALLGGFIAEYIGFRALLWGMFGVSVFSFLASLFLLRIHKNI